ncbi:MAG: M20/M25/M40 family metallo-hydrolase, partial [Acidobacteria bacterium]|nr:M20/M25/M40 family metallo-hydrolase [Acidobacteriota bacterium]
MMSSGWGRPVGMVALAVAMFVGLGLAGPHTVIAATEPSALMRVDLRDQATELALPVHALLQDSAGVTYALVLAPPSAGHPFGAQVLDRDSTGVRYLIALERREGARTEARRRFRVLLDDGRRVVVRDAPGRREELGRLGFDLGLFSEVPMALTPASHVPRLPTITYDPRVADIIAAVTQAATYASDGDLSGENQVTIEGSPYTIATRHTSSGTPIQKATQYVYEYLQQCDLAPTFQNWISGGYSGRNVIGEKLGSTHPDEIVLITAHLDDQPSGSVAPGADDNASGSVGVMLAAQILSQYWFDRTIRFVFFTGEEQGLLGSSSYAAAAQAAGDNIVGVFNMDMIGWDQLDGPTLRIHTRTSGSAGYPDDLAIATMFNDVVSIYGLNGSLTPIIDSDGITASDHASFWSRGYPAVLVIEDDQDDFNQYYHTINDKREYLDMGYMTAYIKASLGTVAHLAVPSSAPCQQNMSALGIDVDTHPASGGASNLNGLLEPGERVVLSPTWHYPDGCSPKQVIGTLTAFTGPTGFTLTIPDESATYGFMMPGEETDCWSEGGNCYETG